MKIAISKGTADHPKYGRYAPWLKQNMPGVETVDLWALSDEQASRELQTVDGLLLTGGSDIDPARYGAAEAFDQCIDVDGTRDAKEFAWLETARSRGMPILAVCRGMQLVNIALGGTLYPDIPAAFPTALAHRSDAGDAEHDVTVEPNTLLHAFNGASQGHTNSSHHQSLHTVAPDLRVTAVAPDGVIEAVEWKDPEGKPFFLGVQWHPERMDRDAPLSKNIAIAFLKAVQS